MDKYEFNIKVEQIKKMAAKGDYATAMKIADTIDWRRVRNANLLSSIADIYEQNQEYAEAKDILLLAFERAPVGKRLLYKLSEISIEAGEIQDAEDFYREFCEMSPEDSRQYLLRYMILKAKGAPAEQLIHSLEQYSSTDVDEKWLYELAVLYAQAGWEEECVRTCDKIMLLFGLGKYVDKAMELKLQYAPLTKQQMDLVENRDKYEEKLRAVEQEYRDTAADYYDEEEISEEPAMPVQESVVPEMSAVNGEREEEAPAKSAVIQEDTEEREEVQQKETPSYEASSPQCYHMIIEAKTREEALNIAIDELKYFHEQYGLNHKVAKTNAEKLNQKGFSVFIPKLEGKDLIIEDAGNLKLEVIDELDAYLEQLNTLNGVVLIDVIDHFDSMAEAKPEFIKRFDIVSDAEEEEEDLFEDIDLNLNPSEKVQDEADLIAEEKNNNSLPVSEEKQQVYIQTDNSAEEDESSYDEDSSYDETYDEDEEYEEEVYDDEYDSYDDAFFEDDEEISDNLPDDYYEEMEIDDFASYAQHYAKQIDCVLPGKTVLALYERIELMEEDEIPLTKATAEELIEEAADRAEKPSFSKRLTGMFNSKYDKEGHLILREEHFIH